MNPGVLWYRWFAKQYGWTPDQVDELPVEFYDWAPVIETADSEASERRQKIEERRNRGGRGQ